MLKENEAILKNRSDVVKKEEGTTEFSSKLTGIRGEAGLRGLGLKRGCL